jgi:hypothetical protein
MAYFYGAYSSDGSPPNRAYLEPGTWQQACGAARSKIDARNAPHSNKTPGCARDATRAVCKDAVPAPQRGGRALVSVRSSTSPLPSRTAFVARSPLGAAPAAKSSATTGDRVALGALGLAADVPLARYAGNEISLAQPTTADALAIYPLNGSVQMRTPAGISEAENAAPGPYAMLLVGLSFAAFMTFRRIGQR